MSQLKPFHLAIPVLNLNKARSFYKDTLGVEEGRSSERWVDFNFYGHQLVIHQVTEHRGSAHNPVDSQQVPVPHFGAVLDWSDWEELAEHLKANNVTFIIEPCIRFEGEVGEQATMFFEDPSGNALEFKAFKDESRLFAR